MDIRRAEKKDIDAIIGLLGQVLEIHAAIRPDIFVSGTTKYSAEELEEMIKNEEKPIYVAADENGKVIGYAFCQLKERPVREYFVPGKEMYIDDLCVDEKERGRSVGTKLFGHVKREAARLGCGAITLNVWRGNDSAEAFYEKLGMTTRARSMEFKL
ncbi:MAG: GNAT family N-acetyltransferase [Clostridia bacterium]|nr:GNAT family N-acetyltransferase [Clostridia bacterium]